MLAQIIKRLPARQIRWSSSANWDRPSPPPLPKEQQREFEQLQRAAQAPAAGAQAEAELTMHPDALKPIKPAFEGDTNPVTGEKGGPKQEPVKQWVQEEGDWSFKGKVSDF